MCCVENNGLSVCWLVIESGNTPSHYAESQRKQRRRKLQSSAVNCENFNITFVLLAFRSSKTCPKTRSLRFLTSWRNATTRRATISSVKVLAVTLSSSSRRVKCEWPFGHKINSKRSSSGRWAKATSSVKKLYKGECSLAKYGASKSRYLSPFSDDLRTANIICDSQEGVTCLVIDRETFNQLISNLDEVKNRYSDEGIIERRK